VSSPSALTGPLLREGVTQVLGPSATRQLTGDLRDLEDATGWKLRLLTSYGAAR
jgi:hypothetical protein